ncbi:hypothetical protein GP486_004452 [Trichoglossum hirsutum]|uniref:Uncharacterized protein n=1 Tax=Trichoglossum hirsutum TaxID=265104 RepID=A0A9P8RP35_9PEZI|nr:hypothetical protein GP486_004452 [Trichoglossum hirsutum]
MEHSLDFTSLSWRKGLPLSTPFITDSDMASFQSYQQQFSPASHVIFGKPESSSALLIITIFTKGPGVGITGMRFDYANGERKVWGVCKGAALNFFLNGIGESIAMVETCQIGPVVSKLKLTTNLQRTCIFPGQSRGFVEYNVKATSHKYIAAHHGNIIGFCGCFVGSQGSLACLGFFTDTSIVCGSSSLDHSPETFFTDSMEDFTVSFRIHGKFKSQITLDKHYDSVQTSVESAGAEFREQGQIVGLLFRSSGSDYPELIGQWVEPGEKYHLAANESILDVDITKWRGPSNTPRYASWTYQVKNIALVTSRQTLQWSQGDRNAKELKPALITWNFNAVFDYITVEPGDGPGNCCSGASRKTL